MTSLSAASLCWILKFCLFSKQLLSVLWDWLHQEENKTKQVFSPSFYRKELFLLGKAWLVLVYVSFPCMEIGKNLCRKLCTSEE